MITEKEVEKIISNPVYVGIGLYPRIVNDDMFIQAGVIAIKEYGLQRYFSYLFENLKQLFGEEYPKKDEIIKEAKEAMKNGKLREFLRCFINDLRKFYNKCRMTSGIPEVIIHFIKVYRQVLYIRLYQSSILFSCYAIQSSKCRFANPPFLFQKKC